MCHLRRINYTCTHHDTLLISHCRFSVSKIRRGGTKNPPDFWLHLKWSGKLRLRAKVADRDQNRVPACRSAISLDIYKAVECGPCQYQKMMQKFDGVIAELEEELAELRGDWGADEGKEVELVGRIGELRKEREEEEWKCRRRFPIMRKRGLEVPERVLGEKVGVTKLKNEIRAEDIEEDVVEKFLPVVDENGVTYTLFADFFRDRYMWVGPEEAEDGWTPEALADDLRIHQRRLARLAKLELGVLKERAGEESNSDSCGCQTPPDNIDTNIWRAFDSADDKGKIEEDILGSGSSIVLMAWGPDASSEVVFTRHPMLAAVKENGYGNNYLSMDAQFAELCCGLGT